MKKIIIAFLLFISASIHLAHAQVDDNAALFYNRAFELYKPFRLPLRPSQPALTEDQLIQSVLQKGWHTENTNLEEFLSQNEPAIDEFNRGIKRENCDFSLGEEYEFLYEKPLPNLLKCRNLATLVIIKGHWYEKNDDFKGALDAYLSVLRFAQHIARNKSLITKITAIAISKMAAKPIKQYLSRPDFDRDISFLTFNRLSELDRTNISLAECFQIEKKGVFDVVANMRLNGLKAAQKNKKLNRAQKDKAISFYNEFLIISQIIIDRYFDPAIEALRTGSRDDMAFAVTQVNELKSEFKDDFILLGEMAEAKDMFYSQKNLNKSLAVKTSKLLVVLVLPNLLETPYLNFEWRDEFDSLKNLAKGNLAKNE